MKSSKHLLLLALIIGLFSLACGLSDDAAKEAEEAIQEVAQTTEAAVGEVAQQVEQVAEESGATAEQVAEEAQGKVAETGEKVEETAEEVQEAAETVAEGDVEEATLDIGSIDATLENFDSYRTKIVMTFDGVDSDGAKSAGKIDVLSEHIKNPPAVHMSMVMEDTSTGEEDGSMSMEIYMVDGMSYTYMDEMGWMSSSAMGDDAFSQGFFSTDDMIQDLPKSARRSLLPQNINGISTWHYTFDENDFEEEGMIIEVASGEMWIARDGDYPVKMIIDVTGTEVAGADSEAAIFFENGSFKLEYELMDVNGNFTITPPEEALSGGGSSDIGLPMMDDAEVQLSMEGMINYYTAVGVQDVVAFYKDNLPAEGWAIDDSFEMVTEDSAMLSFKKDNLDLSLIIGVEDDGRVSVTLMTSEQ